MKTKNLMPGQSFDSLRQRRELLEVKNALDAAQRKLFKTESALESLAGFLAAIPDPIEIVSSDLSILFANEASKRLHDKQSLEGTRYDEIVNLEGSKEDCPIGTALREKREVIFSAALASGDVYETTVAPATLSDGRTAALCISKPVVLSRPGTSDPAEPEPERAAVSSLPPGVDETGLLRRIATLSTRTLDAVLDQITDGVVVASGSGNVILANPAFYRITGYDAGDIFPLTDVLFPDLEINQPLSEFAARLGAGPFEAAVKACDGTSVPVEMTVSVLPEDGENPVGILFTMRSSGTPDQTNDQQQDE